MELIDQDEQHEIEALAPDARELRRRLMAAGDAQHERMEAAARVTRLRDYADAQDES